MTIQDGAAREFAYRLFDCGLEQHSDRRTPVFVVGRHLDTLGVSGRNQDIAGVVGRYLDARRPVNVRISPGNACDVLVSPENGVGRRSSIGTNDRISLENAVSDVLEHAGSDPPAQRPARPHLASETRPASDGPALAAPPYRPNRSKKASAFPPQSNSVISAPKRRSR